MYHQLHNHRCQSWIRACLGGFGAVLTFLLHVRVGSANDAAEGGGWSVDSLPSPVIDPVGCKRPERSRDGSYVCDPDELLTALGAQRADDQLGTISELLTPCENEAQGVEGVEGGVAVITRMVSAAEGMGAPHKQMHPPLVEDFARQVHNGWGIGKHGCDNGFLLFASKEDRQFAISMGKGLEPYLSSKDRKAVLNLMKPHLRKNDWDTAVSVALEEITHRLEKSLGRRTETDGSYLSRDGPRGGFSQPVQDGKWWDRWGFGGAGGGEGGGGDGGGNGIARMMEKIAWPQDGSGLFIVPLIWGISEVIFAVQRRTEQGFEKKLYRVNMQGVSPVHGVGALRAAHLPMKPNDCPICLESFAGGLEMVGADGLPAAVLHCGHTFCQSCLTRWRNPSSRSRRYGKISRQPSTSPGMLCPVCDDAPPRPGDPRFGRRLYRKVRRPRLRRGGGIELSGVGQRRLPKNRGPSSEPVPGRGIVLDARSGRLVWEGRDDKFSFPAGTSLHVPPALGGSHHLFPAPSVTRGDMDAGPASGATSAPMVDASSQSTVAQASDVMGQCAAEMARRDRAFRLASLRIQYPKLMKRHADLFEGQSSETGRLSAGGRNAKRVSRWVSGARPQDGLDDRKSFGGGSSSTATGGRW